MRARFWKELSAERRVAYGVGLAAAGVAVLLLLLPANVAWHAAGPRNVGHENIDCGECHKEAPGNFAGQALTNLGYQLGLGDEPADYVFQPVGNEQCLDCHDNPDNRHPVERFLDPEPEPDASGWRATIGEQFARAREEMQVHRCVSCHGGHQDVRAIVAPDFCRYCHEDTVMEDDPVEIPHSTLIEDGRWDTCLRCHDFHGNHDWEPPLRMSELLSTEQVRRYLDGGDSPYGPRQLTVIQTIQRESEQP